MMIRGVAMKSSMTEEDASSSDFEVDFDQNLHILVKDLLSALKLWLEPLFCVLTYRSLQSQPNDHIFLASLFDEIVVNSIESAESHLRYIRQYVQSIVEICYKSASSESSVSEFCNFCEFQIDQLNSIKKQFRRRLLNSRRDIFDIDTEKICRQLDLIIQISFSRIEKLAKAFLIGRVDQIKALYNKFFSIADPAKFEQTKKAWISLKELDNSIPQLIEKIASNLKFKDYLENRGWALDDSDAKKLYSSCATINDLYIFKELKEKRVNDALEKLREGIGREIQLFMNLWTNVETATNKLFSLGIRRSLDKPNSTRNDGDFPASISDEQVETSLNYIIKHISSASDIANIISKKIEILESVPRMEEMRNIWTLMKSRSTLVNILMSLRMNLRRWKTLSIFSVDIEEIERDGKEFTDAMKNSDLLSSWLVRSSLYALELFIERDLPIIKSLKNPILQVIITSFLNLGMALGFY